MFHFAHYGLLVLPFIARDLLAISAEEFVRQFAQLFTTLVAGIGTGVFIGVFLFKLMKHCKNKAGYAAIVAAALIAYFLAERLGGNGVLATATLGLFFGNSTFKGAYTLLSFEDHLAKAFMIVVLVFLGIAIPLPLSAEFFQTSLALFAVMLCLRFLAVSLSIKSDWMFATFSAQKGMASAAALFVLALAGMTTVASYGLALIAYSLVAAALLRVWEHETHFS